MSMNPTSEEHQTWCAWQSCKEKAITSRKKHYCSPWFAQYRVDKPEGDRKNVLWTDETKMNFLARMRGVLFGNEQPLHSNIRTSSHLWNMVVTVSWFGPALLPLVQGQGLQSLMELWILSCTSKFYMHCLWTEAQQKVAHAARQGP